MFPALGMARDPALFDPQTGYRIAEYRAPVPTEVPGARTVGPDGLEPLLSAGAVLVDVYPLKTHEISADGHFIAPPAHETIPGAIWLPLVGPGRIDARAEAYLEDVLARESGGDLSRPVVVFCLTDCWMSWNASQRIAKLGYSNVHWYPEGTDGWSQTGRPLVRAVPYPLPSRP
ncbi:rhodanese-like domain-containing protein [Paenirhodobacter sp.]|uniref:rhodanese-like domain-containing protein n=1 Tax=Paenirhodobacter sp. TaxID=1965326 RepID=UPI003B40FD90